MIQAFTLSIRGLFVAARLLAGSARSAVRNAADRRAARRFGYPYGA